MELSERDRSVIEHILGYCKEIEETVNHFGNNYESFQKSKIYRNACAMCILQIGELGSRLTPKFRDTYTQMPWIQIKAMRNVMAHAYGDISVQATWGTIQEDIPKLQEFCEKVMAKEL